MNGRDLECELLYNIIPPVLLIILFGCFIEGVLEHMERKVSDDKG